MGKTIRRRKKRVARVAVSTKARTQQVEALPQHKGMVLCYLKHAGIFVWRSIR